MQTLLIATLRLLSLALLWGLALPTHAQERLPETPAGRVAHAWIEAFNAGDRASMLGFSQAHRPAEKLETFDDWWAGLEGARSMLGPLTPDSHRTDGEDFVVVAKVEQLPMRFEVRFAVDPDPPHELLGLELRPAGTTQAELEAPGDWTNLNELLEPLREASGAPAIAVARVAAGRIVEMAVVGALHTEALERSVTAHDRFHIGSLAKSMTASLIGRLVEQGELTWEDTLGQALADLSVHAELRDVTLLEVLQHRAGLPAQLTLTEEEDRRWRNLPGSSTDQRAAFVAEILSQAPQSPGRFQYSNAGYSLAGYWAERATGRPWEELLHEHVVDALRMRHSGVGWPATPARPDQPRGHFSEDSQLRVQGLEEYPLGAFMHPAGHIHASTRDLARYAVAHLNGLVGREDFLLPETVSKLHTPLPGSPYACGWLVNAGVHSHEGSAGTFHALIELHPEQDRGLVVLVNAPMPDLCRTISEAIARRAAEATEATEAR